MRRLPNAIRELRLRHSPPLKQRELAVLVGTSRSMISLYENGKVPTLALAMKIAVALRLPVERVFYALHEAIGDSVCERVLSHRS
jgi:DNA-binding XRE family transcriptional regulator